MQNRSNNRLPDDNESRPSIRSVNWLRLFGYLKPYGGRMVLAILALLLSSGFGLAFPAVIIRLLDGNGNISVQSSA